MTLSAQKTVTAAGTPEPLGTQAVCAPLLLKALPTNTDLVYVGGSSSTGLPLAAGDQLAFEFVGNLASILVDAAVSGEGLAYLILNA